MRRWKCVSVNKENRNTFTIGKIYETDNDGYDCVTDNEYKLTSVSLINEMKCYGGELYFEEIKSFTLSDLKPCMVVVLRDRTICLVIQARDGISLNSKLDWAKSNIKQYTEDFIHKNYNELDIMKVYGFEDTWCRCRISTDDRDLLYKREEKSDKDIKIEELQNKMDEMKNELEKLKGDK